MNLSCKDETALISQEYFNGTITKAYTYSHDCWIEGIDSLGKTHKIQMHGFTSVNDLAMSGDKLYKDSSSLDFRLKRNNYLYTFTWDCLTGGKLMKVDTLKLN
ncbi:hypothetical protein C3K47_19330 [Solitalea longa]|uniref:Uncharacterized protein n=2 Tax=Solitalea longa TaxID=2079460 RepID=A0A2S4ZW86_9SPHI|nr:hypothetical protein C3K47_19330 [Solitalea longa]